MTQEEVLGYNKLIAEFLGRNGKINKSLYSWKGIDALLSGGWVPIEQTKFHSDWNWLMEVVVKCIENCLKLKNVGFTQNSKIYNGLIEVDIDKVYQGCVEFIKWYNENK